jgi:MerR family transcriptional regulator, light-induced transcriptional regulator
VENAQPNHSVAPTYRSGTAARLAGIPVATLRMWERRYRVVGPQVSPRGHRHYGAADVDRLALIKALVDLGHPIGTLAHLPVAALRELRAAPGASFASAHSLAPKPSIFRVAIVGEALVAQGKSAPHRAPSLQIVATCADRTQAAAMLRGVVADLLAIELPVVREDAVELVDALITALGARRAVVAYRFGTEAALQDLRRRGHAVAHAPIDLAAIESLGLAALGVPESPMLPLPVAPAPRFDEQTLAQLSQVSTTVRCECPRQIVDLLLNLGAFERYSAECENRSPADADLHRYLSRVAGNARALFEDALVRAVQADGIALPEPNRRVNPEIADSGAGSLSSARS